MRLFELSQNGLTYRHPRVIWGNDGRVHLDYEVSGFGTGADVRFELCIYTDETCGVLVNDLGAATTGVPNALFLRGIFAECLRVKTELNELIRNSTIS